MTPRTIAAGICIALIALGLPVPASARPGGGRLDPTYGRDGLTFTSFGVAGEEADVELTVTSGGAAVVADGFEGTAVRFGASGSRDARFGKGGQLVVVPGDPIGGRKLKFYPTSVTADRRGRVLVFGERFDRRRSAEGPNRFLVSPRLAMVLRFKADGHLDPSFGEGKGYIAGDFGLPPESLTGFTAAGILAGRVDAENRPLFVAGTAVEVGGCYGHGSAQLVPEALVRLTESGHADTAFGDGDGVSPIVGSGQFPVLAVDAANQPVAGVGRVGSYAAGCGAGTSVYRFGEEGEPMAAFGPAGVREFTSVHLSLVEPSGAMILSDRDGRKLKLVQVDPEGNSVMGFGQGGVARLRLPSTVGLHLSPAAVDAKGRILLAGFVGSPGSEPEKGQPKQSSLVLARLLPDGKLDQSFGKRGWLFTHLPDPLKLIAAQASLDRRGRLLVAGIVTKPHHRDGAFVAARYLLGP